jgi:hypothetical protein
MKKTAVEVWVGGVAAAVVAAFKQVRWCTKGSIGNDAD